MALGGDDAQTAQSLDLFVHHVPLLAQLCHANVAGLFRQTFVGLSSLDVFFDVATQYDVGATTGHVGRDCDHAGAACLGHDVGLAGVLLGIKHLVRQLLFRQQLGNQLRVFDRGGAHQHRLTALVAFANIGNRGVVPLL